MVGMYWYSLSLAQSVTGSGELDRWLNSVTYFGRLGI